CTSPASQPCGGADLSSDPNNCGSCGVVCAQNAVCQGGQCLCKSGLTYCPGTGACLQTCPQPTCEQQDLTACYDNQAGAVICVATSSNGAHCGSCDSICSESGTTCVGGKCVCSDGLTFCSQRGCVDLANDQDNCGDCGNACDGDKTCIGGTC